MPAPDRKRRLTAFVVAMAVLVATPLAVVAADAFTDVPNTNVFHDDIAWLATAGVTKGCNPPDNTEFCPSDNVTREQMAAFMRRLAENQVVDAATAATAETAETAGDADTVDGKHADELVAKGEANSVTAAMTTNEPGASQASAGTSVALTSTPTSVLSQDITVPGAGLVLVMATWEAWASHSNPTSDISQFDVSNTDGVFPEPGNARNFIVAGSAPSGTYTVVSGSQRVFPVASSGTYTFYLVGAETSGSVQADDMVLTLMYVPTTYGGLDTLGLSGGGTDAAD